MSCRSDAVRRREAGGSQDGRIRRPCLPCSPGVLRSMGTCGHSGLRWLQRRWCRMFRCDVRRTAKREASCRWLNEPVAVIVGSNRRLVLVVALRTGRRVVGSTGRRACRTVGCRRRWFRRRGDRPIRCRGSTRLPLRGMRWLSHPW